MENTNLLHVELQIQDLTWREQEVLGLLAKRLSDKEIGSQLNLAVNTVKWYNRQIFAKLGVKNRKQAAIRVGELKFLESQEKKPVVEPRLLNNLPAQLSSFVGRKKEIAEVKLLLETGRLIVITGAGGSGKTRLALQVSEEIINSYKDGVWFVELATVTDPQIVPNEIAKVLQIGGNGNIEQSELLKQFLEQKQLLLVLDNLEHLEDAAPMVGEILAAAPNLTVLVTSRVKINIYGEQEYSLTPLSLPDLDKTETTERLLGYGAVDLFIQRSKPVQLGLVLDNDDILAVAKICIRLDGLPLAIELAAPLAKIYGFATLAERLELDLAVLPVGPRNMPERQRTLLATMDWSYKLLKENEQVLFERLSIFGGGCTLEAIENICADGMSGTVIDILSSLVENNLIIPVEKADGELHFQMLDTIKDYGYKRQLSRPDADEINRKHASYYTDLAELSLTEIRGPRNSYWFKRLKEETQNFRLALTWSLNGTEPEYGFRMVGPLSYYWYYNGLIRENSHWIDLALEKSTQTTPSLRAKVLLTAGIIAYNLHDLEKSQDFLRSSVEMYQDLGDEIFESFALVHLAMASLSKSQKSEDILYRVVEASEIFRKHKNTAYLAMAYNVMGEITRFHGEYKEAQKHYQHSLSLSKDTGEVVREATLHGNLGVVAFHLDEYVISYQKNKAALLLSVEIQSPFRKAYHLALIAGPIAALGFPLRAAQILGAATAELEKLGFDQETGEQTDIDLYISIAQKVLEKKAFQEAWEEGKQMIINDAVAYALNDLSA